MLIVIFVDVCLGFCLKVPLLQIVPLSRRRYKLRQRFAPPDVVVLFRSFAGYLHGVILGHIIQGREKTV